MITTTTAAAFRGLGREKSPRKMAEVPRKQRREGIQFLRDFSLSVADLTSHQVEIGRGGDAEVSFLDPTDDAPLPSERKKCRPRAIQCASLPRLKGARRSALYTPCATVARIITSVQEAMAENPSSSLRRGNRLLDEITNSSSSRRTVADPREIADEYSTPNWKIALFLSLPRSGILSLRDGAGALGSDVARDLSCAKYLPSHVDDAPV